MLSRQVLVTSPLSAKYALQVRGTRTAAVRRMKLKSLWKPAPLSDDEPFELIPKRWGNMLDHNWSFLRAGVCVETDGFRNLHLRGLMMRSKATLDASKALHFESKNLPFTIFTNELGPQVAKRMFALVCKRLSAVDQVFMEDGVLGDSPFRLITDNANLALMAHHLLHRGPLREAYTHKPELRLFLSDVATVTALVRVRVLPDSVKNQGVVIHRVEDQAKKELPTSVMVGSNGEAVMTAMVQLYATTKPEQPILRNCATVYLPDGATALLLIDPSADFKFISQPHIHSSGFVTLVDGKLLPLFRGHRSPYREGDQVCRGTAVEHTVFEGKSVAHAVTSNETPINPPRLPFPTSCIIHITSSGPSKKASADEMMKVLANHVVNADVSALKSGVEGAPCFTISMNDHVYAEVMRITANPNNWDAQPAAVPTPPPPSRGEAQSQGQRKRETPQTVN